MVLGIFMGGDGGGFFLGGGKGEGGKGEGGRGEGGRGMRGSGDGLSI